MRARILFVTLMGSALAAAARAQTAPLSGAMSAPAGDMHFYLTRVGGVARLWASSAVNLLHPPQYEPATSNVPTSATNFMWSGGGGVVSPQTVRARVTILAPSVGIALRL
jgi:hypothetical protein